MSVRISDVVVHGIGVDSRTGCAHYRSPLDVIAIRHHCCGDWYACIECHQELADHPPTAWPRSQFNEVAVLCGACGAKMTINEYLDHADRCARCETPFNPGCALHHHLYFEVEKARRNEVFNK